MDPEQIPLRDLHLPDVVGLWPLAPGWWVLMVLAVAGAIYLLYQLLLRWRFNAARRLALRELTRLRRDFEDGVDATVLSKALSELVRRSMLAYAPRAEVAGLTGDTWLSWLDRGLSDAPFSSGAGRMLESLPYQRATVIQDDVNVSALLEVVQLRLQTPLPVGTA